MVQPRRDPNPGRAIALSALLLVAAPARRLRGLRSGNVDDLRAALEGFERMRSRPFIARAKADIGLLTGETAVTESAIAELEAVGDVEHATRVAGQAKSASAVGG